MDLEDTVKNIISIWREKEKEIEEKLSGRIKVLNKINNEKKAGKLFHVPKPLKAYINVSNSLTLRYCGQIVAGLRVENDVPKLCVNKKHVENNKKYFKLDTPECKVKWKSKESTVFRKKFLSLEKNQKECTKIHSPEHQVETNLLRAMRGAGKKSGHKGAILGYQPVLLSGLPFQMPMPISGSSGEPKYTNRGHIDILARTGKGRGVKLSVWELKKHEISCNDFAKAIKQAVIYATSLVLMLRSEYGKDWYKFFGFSKGIPENLRVEAVVVVSEQKQADFKQKAEEFVNKKELQIDDKGVIIPCVAYYNENNYKIEKIVPCR